MSKLPDDWVAQLKAAYPKRSRGKNYAWPKALIEVRKRIKEGYSFEDILEGTKNYCQAAQLSGDYGTEFIKMASTFYGVGLHFMDEYELEDPTPEVRYRKPQELSEEQRTADILKFERDMERFGK